MSYRREQAIHLCNMARSLGLSGAELLSPPEVVMRDCNGIGPAWMPDAMRKACTDLNAVMEVPAAIHDRRYSLGTTRADRQTADDEFLENCFIVIDAEYAWYNPMRYVYRRRAKRFHELLRLFGGVAFGKKGGEK